MRFIHIADVHLGMQPDAGFPWSEERGEPSGRASGGSSAWPVGKRRTFC